MIHDYVLFSLVRPIMGMKSKSNSTPTHHGNVFCLFLDNTHHKEVLCFLDQLTQTCLESLQIRKHACMRIMWRKKKAAGVTYI
jgi:hypothetical protein